MDFLPEMNPAPAVPQAVIKDESPTLFDDAPALEEPHLKEPEDDGANCPEPVARSILRNDEVFRDIQKKVAISKEPDLVVKPIQGAERPPNLTKKGRAKRVASEKQKAHLKNARIKALETRRRKKKEKDEANGIFEDHEPPTPEPPVPDNPPAPAVTMPRPPSPTPEPEREPTPVPQTKEPMQFVGYTQDEMNEAVFAGIQRYDGQRKKEKKAKKIRLAKEEHDRRVVQTIQNAVGPTHQSDPWSSVFSFT